MSDSRRNRTCSEQTLDSPSWFTSVYPLGQGIKRRRQHIQRGVCEPTDRERTSGYHAQGNGFAERSIRNVREVLRTALLDKGLAVKNWRKILSSIIFALNSSKSKSINCSPYEVVFGRKPTLPIDIEFDSVDSGIRATSAIDYLEDLKVQLLENIRHASKFLGIARDQMIKQYNKNLHVIKYELHDQVWLHKKTFKQGENAKLSPRKSGPWKVIKLYPNGVNFKIEDASGNQQVVHHNRMSPVRESPVSDYDESDESDVTDYETASEGDDDELLDDDQRDPDVQPPRRYPLRERKQRHIPGAISWDDVQL